MRDTFPVRLAEVLIRYSLTVQPGQVIAIEAVTTAEPLIRALHTATHRDLVCDLRRGGEVTVDGAVFLCDGQFQVS
jgi:hypothetical protein